MLAGFNNSAMVVFPNFFFKSKDVNLWLWLISPVHVQTIKDPRVMPH
jgi:hypothetical protein